MKKITIIFIICILFSSFAHALANKKIEFLALGGINFFNQRFSYPMDFPPPRHEARLAYSLGIGLHLYLAKAFTLEAEVLYKTKKSELVELSGVEWGDAFYKFSYLAFPLLAHYIFKFSTFSIFTTFGLETDILLKSQVNDKRNDVIIEPIENTRAYDFQLVPGFGIKYQEFSFQLRYGIGLLNLNTDHENALTVRNIGFEFFIVYHF